MKFINRKTGAIIDSDSLLGGAWEIYEPTKDTKTKEKTVKKEEVNTKEEEKKETSKETDLTVREIKQELDAFGVEYNSKATKSELLKILEDFKIKE